MKISDQGIELIQRFEGCRLGAYKDAVGVPTIGYGHTHDVKMGDYITQEEAEELLHKDIAQFEECVNKMFAGVTLVQTQFDALVSFAFNLGCGALRNSTLRRKIEAHKWHEAADEFSRWCHAGHRKLKGLVRRRAAEKELFLS
jgi:lysozyme